MFLKPLQIGNVITKPNLVLAPMSGVTNSSFRRLLREENPDALGLVVTEFVSIEGLTRGNKRTCNMLKFEEYERPISIQIFGHDLDRMVEAAKLVEDTGAEIVDINCGCPVPRVVRRGGGAELMRQADHLEKILSSIIKEVKIPVTLKIRSGWDDNSRNAVEVAKMAEAVGVKMLAVHGRTRQQLYRGQADWEIISEVAKQISIPVVGSGDVVNTEFAKSAFEFGVSGLMIGRGAIENPFIFTDIQNSLLGIETEPRRPSEYLRVVLRYYDLLMEEMGPKGTTGRLKQMISQLTRKIPGASQNRRFLCTQNSSDAIRDSITQWRQFLLEN